MGNKANIALVLCFTLLLSCGTIYAAQASANSVHAKSLKGGLVNFMVITVRSVTTTKASTTAKVTTTAAATCGSNNGCTEGTCPSGEVCTGVNVPSSVCAAGRAYSCEKESTTTITVLTTASTTIPSNTAGCNVQTFLPIGANSPTLTCGSWGIQDAGYSNGYSSFFIYFNQNQFEELSIAQQSNTILNVYDNFMKVSVGTENSMGAEVTLTPVQGTYNAIGGCYKETKLYLQQTLNCYYTVHLNSISVLNSQPDEASYWIYNGINKVAETSMAPGQNVTLTIPSAGGNVVLNIAAGQMYAGNSISTAFANTTVIPINTTYLGCESPWAIYSGESEGCINSNHSIFGMYLVSIPNATASIFQLTLNGAAFGVATFPSGNLICTGVLYPNQYFCATTVVSYSSTNSLESYVTANIIYGYTANAVNNTPANRRIADVMIGPMVSSIMPSMIRQDAMMLAMGRSADGYMIRAEMTRPEMTRPETSNSVSNVTTSSTVSSTVPPVSSTTTISKYTCGSPSPCSIGTCPSGSLCRGIVDYACSARIGYTCIRILPPIIAGTTSVPLSSSAKKAPA